VPPNVQTVFPRVQDFKCNLPICLGCSAAAERYYTGRFWRVAGCKLAMVHTWEPEGIFFREIKILLRRMSGEQSKEKAFPLCIPRAATSRTYRGRQTCLQLYRRRQRLLYCPRGTQTCRGGAPGPDRLHTLAVTLFHQNYIENHSILFWNLLCMVCLGLPSHWNKWESFRCMAALHRYCLSICLQGTLDSKALVALLTTVICHWQHTYCMRTARLIYPYHVLCM
jgi:hypothetical protein